MGANTITILMLQGTNTIVNTMDNVARQPIATLKTSSLVLRLNTMDNVAIIKVTIEGTDISNSPQFDVR